MTLRAQTKKKIEKKEEKKKKTAKIERERMEKGARDRERGRERFWYFN